MLKTTTVLRGLEYYIFSIKEVCVGPASVCACTHTHTHILPLLLKVLRHAAFNQLSLLLSQNSPQDPNQSAFNAAHSTTTNFVSVIENFMTLDQPKNQPCSTFNLTQLNASE